MILLAIGFLTIGTMIWCILRDSYNKPQPKANVAAPSNRNDMIIEDQSESNYETVDGGGDESVYDSN